MIVVNGNVLTAWTPQGPPQLLDPFILVGAGQIARAAGTMGYPGRNRNGTTDARHRGRGALRGIIPRKLIYNQIFKVSHCVVILRIGR
jgi:hypothetical protein